MIKLKERILNSRARIIIPRRAKSTPPPGTVSPPEDAIEPRLYVIAYGPVALEEQEIQSVSELKELLGRQPVTWLNIDGVGSAETINALGEQFGLHPLALEDVVNLHQRPKTEDYEDHAYIVIKMPTDSRGLYLEQLSIFVGPGYVITVQEHEGDCLESVRYRLRKSIGRIRKLGADYLAYAVIDVVIDQYFPIIERINERLEELEDRIMRSPDEETLAEIHTIRHDLHTLRRAIAPTREAINQLMRSEMAVITDGTRLFLRDCQDHTAQLLDAIEACRELSMGLTDLHLSSASNRMNEVMKVLTLIATIFIPLGFIAGLYGMNFDPSISPWNMPELSWYFGYPMALGLMVVTTLGFLVFFRRRGWLGERRKSRRRASADERKERTGKEGR